MGKELVRVEKTVATVDGKAGTISRRNVFKKIGQVSLAAASLFLFTKQDGCSYSDWANYSDYSDYSDWANWYNYSSPEK